MPPFNAAKLLQDFDIDYETANPESLKNVGLSASFSGNLDQASIKDLLVTLDQTKLNGFATVKNFEKPSITFDLNLNELNLDDYLPPSVEEEEDEESFDADALSVPMEAFKDLQANGQFKAASLISGGVELTNIDVQVLSLIHI